MSSKFAALLVMCLGIAALGAWSVLLPVREWLAPERPRGAGQPDHGVAQAPSGPLPLARSLNLRFAQNVQPFVQRYCISCHGPTKLKAGLDLSRNSTVAAVVANTGHWELVLQRLQGEE